MGSPVARISDFARSLPPAWRLLGPEQRVAAVGSLLLIVSTFGPFTFVEAAEVLTALAVLALLKRRTDGSVFHLPFGDGTAVAAAGAWCGLLILVRLFDRSLGQDLLALACAGLVFVAGMRERAKRPMDDLPPETVRVPRERPGPPRERPEPPRERAQPPRERPEPPRDAPTTRLPRDADVTEPVRPDADATEPIPRDADQTERINGPRDPGSGSGEPQL
ncbi:MAG: hypothetical protein QOC55_1959 [Thermoleophilaceae bacterium]|nr:hypothetical protein [Thermoleophilaceae bacterium]